MKKLRFLLPFLFFPSLAQATVTLSTATWTNSLGYGSTITITCAGAGTKPAQTRTYAFANFEDATVGFAPSTWSVASSFGDIQNLGRLTTNCFNGTACAGNTVDMAGLKNFTANVNIPDVGASGKIMMSVMWYRDGTNWPTSDVDSVHCSDSPPVYNLKTFRMWASGNNFNDTYGGQQCDGGFEIETESHNGFATTGFDRVFTNRMRPPSGSYEQVEWYFQLNSSASGNSTDGQLIVNEGGTTIVTNTTFRYNTSLDAGNGRWALMYPMHMVWANNTFPSSNCRFDNVVVDTSWCAVWVTTVSTNMVSATKYFLPVVTWADTQVAVAFAQKLSGNTSYYLYIQDNNRNVNSSGLSILTGGTGGGAPTNQAPIPNAGTSQTITLPATVSLSGSYTDDGLPNPPATVTTTWSKLSGPGTVTFGNASNLSTTATFGTSGTYVLRLTADDSALQGTSDVTITVNAAVVTPPSGKTFRWKRRS